LWLCLTRRPSRPVELEDSDRDAELHDLIEQASLLPAGVIAAQGDQDVIRREIENSWTSAAGDYITRDAWRRIVEPGLRPSSTGSAGT
jgi:hypothetical protein